MLVAVAVGGGGGIGIRSRGRPHFYAWAQFHGLVRDGVAFTRRGGKSASEAAPAISLRSPLRVPAATGHSGQTKKSSHHKKKKSSHKSGTNRGESATGPAAATHADAAPWAPPAAQREWMPTRTGHLALGARETGVKVRL